MVWLHETPLEIGRQYAIKHTCNAVSGTIVAVDNKIDMDDLSRVPTDVLRLNDVGDVTSATDGRGQTDFAVWTASENASLGCSATVQCALVAVPIVGLSCDAWGTKLPEGSVQSTRTGTPLTGAQLATADGTCRRTGAYLPGEPRSSTTSDQAVRGNLWWSASNWRNRITVPLGFAQTGSVCDAVSEEAPQEVLERMEVELIAGTYVVRFGGEVADRGTFTVDGADLTLVGVAGTNAGRTIPCIFKFTDDLLSICYGLGGTRPTKYRTGTDPQLYLVNYTRKQ